MLYIAVKIIIMTKILLLSDTHGYIDDLMIKHIKSVDEVWHAGDIGSMEVVDNISKIKSLRAVYGNIDGQEIRAQFPLDQQFIIENTKVWITHIGGYPNRYERRVYEGFTTFKPDLFISGHSHVLKIMYDKKRDLLHLNPGAIGKNGFHKMRTMLRFAIHGKEIKDMEIIEYTR